MYIIWRGERRGGYRYKYKFTLLKLKFNEQNKVTLFTEK